MPGHALTPTEPQPVFVLIPTHTPRYLALVLAALAGQTTRAAHVVVSCDVDDDAIGTVVERAARQHAMPISWVRRAHHSGERLCQVRNNGVRHLAEQLGHTTGRLLVLDGDMLAPPETIERHARHAAHADLVYPYRTNLHQPESQALTEAIDIQAALRAAFAAHPNESEQRELAQRERRYRKQLLMRRLRLGPLHKPKLLGGHFSVDLAWYLRLNGFDEHYQGWGFKDDEFAWRAARLGARVVVAVRAIPALHLWHETRQAAIRMADLPTAQRFAQRARLPLIAEHGVRDPLEQHPVRASVFGSAR